MDFDGLDKVRIKSLFYKYGVKNLSMDEVVKELGISKKTLYKKVSSKKQLVEWLVKDDIEVIKNTLSELEEDFQPPIEKLNTIFRLVQDLHKPLSAAFLFSLDKMFPDLSNSVETIYHHKLKSTVQTVLSKGIKEGAFLNQYEDEMVYYITNFLHQSGVSIVRGQEQNIDLNRVFYLQIRAICTVSGIRELDEYFVCSK